MLRQAVQGISDIITIPGVINRDFADVKTTMAGMGYAVMGTAMRSGENRASRGGDGRDGDRHCWRQARSMARAAF